MIIIIVIVNIDAIVETVIAFDNSSVSSPIFSDWIRGRFPIGIIAMSEKPRTMISLHPRALRIKKSAVGSMIILITMYAQIRTSLNPLFTPERAMETPRSAMDRNTVAFPM